jgi:putative membrane protein
MPIKKEHLVFGALALLFLLVVAYEAFYYIPGPSDMMDHHSQMHGFMAGQMGPSLLGFNILFWILIIVLVILFIKGTDTDKSGEDEAIKILNERYAKGEITREEYLEKFRDLKEG